jgi:hypothetical protein
LRKVADSGSVYNRQYNPAFVLMQYYGYLRRNPSDAPDHDLSGYNFWLTKLNNFSQPGEDVRDPVTALARIRRADGRGVHRLRRVPEAPGAVER